MSHFLKKILALALFALTFSVQSQVLQNQNQKIYTLETLPVPIRKAVTAQVYLTENQIRSSLDGNTVGYLIFEMHLEAQSGFFLYEDQLEVSGEKPWIFKITQSPEKRSFLDPITKKIKTGYTGQSIFQLRADLSEAQTQAFSVDSQIPVMIRFQACDKNICLLPVMLKLEVPLVADARLIKKKEVSSLENAVQSLQKSLASNEQGAFIYLILLFAGIITAFTPCVYPLYPITLGIFARWQKVSQNNALLLVLFYCLGLTLSYSLLGLLSASSGALFGSLTQTPSFLISVGLIIALSAIFFSGLLPFQAPQFLQNIFTKAEDQTPRSQRFYLAQSFFMGSGLGVVAAPCVGPVLIALLAWLATSLSQESGAYFKGFSLLFVFGMGMSLPFMILGFLSLKLKKQPRMGRFTPYFKHLGSLLMLVGSLFFLVPGIRLLTYSNASNSEKKFTVYNFDTWPQKLEAARWSVIDFRADWCAACLELESHTFTKPAVSKLFETGEWHFVQADLTKRSPENTALAQKWDVVALPTVLLVHPSGKVCTEHTLYGFENDKAFKMRLLKAQNECKP